MSELHWQLLVSAWDVLSARLITDRLAGEGIQTRVVTDAAAVMGQAAPCRIFVDSTQVPRARRLLAEEPLTESELTFLATGELPGDPTRG
jgi:hypothetical protein